jgi:hypothetical protein
VGDGCFHGIFRAGPQQGDWWFLVDVETPGQHRFAIQDCDGRQLRFGVFDAAGTTELESAEFTEGSCPVLGYDIAESGTDALHLELLAGTAAGARAPIILTPQ